ncbi:MAG TPA: ABC transporter substrate-binding protein [Spirochaetota bacterium]|nr:ABC transporter substrate-binding protein [Spirochaetota bacterium]HPV41357.1 ABC transporter substrate-binding protein [Spirochaetota bacterium]
MIYIGIDDTDTLKSRGTGRLARNIAAILANDFAVLGVVRHQLLQDPRVPFTSHNSSATIILKEKNGTDLAALFRNVKDLMLADFQVGSDPGLCVTRDIPDQVIEHGRNAQKRLVTQAEARDLARTLGIALEGLGGTEDGVIGALASVGLTATGNDGRYLLCGRVRDLSGLLPVEAVIGAGVTEVRTIDEKNVTAGMVMSDKIRPARRDGKPVAYVEWRDDHWEPLKLN